jgi:aryl-phospho-beta-D-glucosidase BglC (GH1 family)
MIKSTIRIFTLLLVSLLCLSSCTSEITDKSFLKAEGKVLRTENGKGKIVYLHGVNAGGYLVQEFWMTPTAASGKVKAQSDILFTLEQRFGKEKAKELINTYEDSYWTDKDFDNIKQLGANCIRLPFWYRNLTEADGTVYDDAFKRIDWFVTEAGKRGLYIILDMHGAPGSQNGSDHSGVDGGSKKKEASQFFFGSNATMNQQQYYSLWEKIADHYKGNPTIAGYDILNEPFCTYRYNSGLSDSTLHTLLYQIYNETYKRIRNRDPDHIIFMEATWDPSDLPDPHTYKWTNVAYEYHNYLYGDYDNVAGKQITNMKNKLNAIAAANYNVPSLLGEFNYMNNYEAWDEGLTLLTNAKVSWTVWTYKTLISEGNWGMYHHPMTTGKINLEAASFDEIKKAWSQTGESQPNSSLIAVLKKHM